MVNPDLPIYRRELGAAPMSIGTSLAFEGYYRFGEYADEKPHRYGLDNFWINLRTLFRNAYGAFNKQDRLNLGPDVFKDAMVEDLMVINSIVNQYSNHLVSVEYYLCSFKSFEKTFPKGLYKELNTPNQQFDQNMEDATIELFKKGMGELPFEFTLKEFDTKIRGNNKRVAILTHYPVDLLGWESFSRLYLLESHTGKIKDRTQWYTKLTGGKRYQRIPFNSLTLQVFGDNNLLFASMLPSIKKRILDIAEEDNWTNATTVEKVRVSINKIPYPVEKRFFLELLK